jgi:hypothetical protein
MVYESLYNLLKGVADNLPYDVEFSHGRGSDINIFAQNNKSTMVWLSPMRASGSFPNNGNRLFKNYTVELGFYQSDKVDSTNDQTRSILQTTDKILTNYLLALNETIPDLDGISDDVSITGLSILPFIKITTHILSGHVATFNISLPDDFKYCC